LAKEAKSKFGLASLVCDPEEYDFDTLDQVPDDCVAFFVMATYGEGEPTDNAVQLMQNLSDESFIFSKGERRLDGLKYVVFSLGNRTYEHYNVIGKYVDEHLSKMGAVRIGERGEGDDDKSMEEDYLEWKDGMWEEFVKVLGVEEGQGGDTADFAVSELNSHPAEKVYLGVCVLSLCFSTCPDLEKVNFLLVLLPRQKASTMPRIPSPLPSSTLANFSRTPNAIVPTSSSALKDLASLISMGITLEYGPTTPRSKWFAYCACSDSTESKTPLLESNLLTLPLPRFHFPSQRLTRQFFDIT